MSFANVKRECIQFHNAPAALVKDSTQYFIFHDANIIGRKENAFISLLSPMISRQHCIIERIGENSFTIKDTSSQGTMLNGKRLVKNQAQLLQHHDKIQLPNTEGYYEFVLLKKLKKETDELQSSFSEKISNLKSSHSEQLEKLNQELSKIESEKLGLKDVMNCTLDAKENMFKQEQAVLSNQLSSPKEIKDEALRKLKELQEKSKSEKEKLMQELEHKIIDISRKEKELQQLKDEMELRHTAEINELEKKSKAEVEELKLKLAESEVEQGRLLGQTQEVTQQLEETKKILQQCEMEHDRFFDEREELATKFVDLTKESKEKDKKLRDLEKRLQEKEEADEKLKKEMEVLEDQLQCSICVELFIDPTVLNCGHMFCKACITHWETKKKRCPICRTKISSTLRIFNLDTIIDRNVALLSAEARQRREALILERQKIPRTKSSKKRKLQRPTHNIVEHPLDPPFLQITPIGDWSTPSFNVEQVDPFTWFPQREPRFAFNVDVLRGDVTRLVEPPVSVAAIDLTNLPSVPEPTRPRRSTRSATSTSTSGTIDLTTT